MHYVWPANIRKNGKFFWFVTKHGADKFSMPLSYGWSDTMNFAVRAARNFIRHNQNAVYG